MREYILIFINNPLYFYGSMGSLFLLCIIFYKIIKLNREIDKWNKSDYGFMGNPSIWEYMRALWKTEL